MDSEENLNIAFQYFAVHKEKSFPPQWLYKAFIGLENPPTNFQMIVDRLYKDGYLHLIPAILRSDEAYRINGNGLSFVDNLPLEYKGRPYSYHNILIELEKQRIKEKEDLEIRQITANIDASESVISTNKFSLRSAGISILLTIVVISLQFYTCHRDNLKDIAASEKDKRDSLTQSQKAKSDKELNEELHRISQSLSDTSKVKGKIEK